jgi:hypothetical protein
MKYCIKTKYFGPTNTKGARIKAFCLWGSVVVGYDHGARNPHWVAVRALMDKLCKGGKSFMLAAEEVAGPDGGTLYIVDIEPHEARKESVAGAMAARELAGREAA